MAYEAVRMANLVKNHHLAKSSNDAAWGQVLSWLRSSGARANVPVVAVSPTFTTPDGSGWSERVKNSLGVANPWMPSGWSGAGSGRERGPHHALSCLGFPGSPPYRRAGGNGSRIASGATLLDRRPLANAGSCAPSSRLAEGRIPAL
jgi:hypothetical protein